MAPNYWTPESDGRIRTAWENGGPSLPDLADSAGVTEVALITRMLGSDQYWNGDWR